jgi:hypothetical protein
MGEEALPDQTLESDEVVTAALPVTSDPLTHASPCPPEQTSSLDGGPGLSKVADTLHNAVATTLLYRGSTRADGKIHAAAAAYRTVLNCASKSDDDAEPLAQIASAERDDPLGLSAGDWRVERTHEGAYFATHPEHPDLHLRLEMYGSGEPELLHWQELDEPLGGIGLLHYRAGASPEGGQLEYVAVIDTGGDRLLAIEPASWGKKQAKWTWSETDLVVVDPQGVPSRVFLDGQVATKLRLNGKQIAVERTRPSQQQRHIAKRPKPHLLPYAEFKPPRRSRRYGSFDATDFNYGRRIPPRFRQRRSAYAYQPYR